MAGYSYPPGRDRKIIHAAVSRNALPTPARTRLATGPYRAIKVVTDVTAASGSPSLVTNVYGIDLANKRYLIAAGVALTAISQGVLTVGPDLANATTGNVKTVVDYLPEQVEVEVTGTPGTTTYSVTAELIP